MGSPLLGRRRLGVTIFIARGAEAVKRHDFEMAPTPGTATALRRVHVASATSPTFALVLPSTDAVDCLFHPAFGEMVPILNSKRSGKAGQELSLVHGVAVFCGPGRQNSAGGLKLSRVQLQPLSRLERTAPRSVLAPILELAPGLRQQCGLLQRSAVRRPPHLRWRS